MNINIPVRGKLLAEIPLFMRINALQRPRINQHSKTIYQPKQNQMELLESMLKYAIPTIDCPIIVDSYINFFPKPKSRTWPSHPVSPVFGDEDNLRKALNDALQWKHQIKGKLVKDKIIKDDNLVLGGEHFKAYGDEDYAIIRIYRAEEETISKELP